MGGPVSGIDFNEMPVSPVSRLDTQGPQSIDFKATKVSQFHGQYRISFFYKSAVSSITNNPRPETYYYNSFIQQISQQTWHFFSITSFSMRDC